MSKMLTEKDDDVVPDDMSGLINGVRKFSIGEDRMSPFEDAKGFVKREFPDWKTGCHVLYNVVREKKKEDAGDEAEEKLVRVIDEFARENKQEMFVMVNVKPWKKNRESDIIIIHRSVGVVDLEVKHRQVSSSGDAEAERLKKFIKEKSNQAKQGVKRIMQYYKEEFPGSSATEKVADPKGAVYTCFPCNILPEQLQYCKEEGVLTADECESTESFKNWWEKFIYPGDGESRSKRISKETYLNLLSL